MTAEPLTIAANLLPPEIVAARRLRRVRRAVVGALGVLVILLGGWYTDASYQAARARADVRTAEADVAGLGRQQSAFAEVTGTQAQSQAISAQLAALLAGDLRWSRLLAALQQAAPKDVQLTSLSGAVGTADAAGPRLPAGSAEKAVGTITLSGTGAGKPTVAAYVDVLAKVPGLANPYLSDASVQDGAVQFTVRLDIVASALGGRYTPKTPGGN